MRSLHVDSIIKAYNNKQVLTDVFVSCNSGEIVGLIGRNGSGKSTLLKIIFGSLVPERKFVKIDEEVLNTLFRNSRKIKYLPQHGFLPDHIRLNEVVNLFCNKACAKKIKEHEKVKLFLKKKCKQLSGGERRFFEVLLIIYSDAQFILLDEPFNGIAPIYKEEIKKIITEQSLSKGFIITDHDYRNVIDISTKHILLHDGGTKPILSMEDLKYWGYLSEN
ncbi:MAG: ATP-binding cassette domain-containing protein [Salinivirgaceae bacterium]|nr:ATP-binding cassette domain-containing protein [Salinivirgaceae bacterium]